MTRTLLLLGALSFASLPILPTVQPVQASHDDRDRDGARERRVRYEDLPGPVKRAFSRERGRDRIVEVTELRYRGNVTYRAEIEGPNNTSRLFRVNRDGEYVGGRNTTPEGRQSVSIDTLSGPVRRAFLSRSGNYDRIVQVTRDKETWYVGFSADGMVYRVDSEGRVFDTQDRDDYRDYRNRDYRDRDYRDR